MEKQLLNEEELEQATGGAGFCEPYIEFSLPVTDEDTAFSLMAKIYLAKPDISENEADWILNETAQLMQQGQFGTFMARIMGGNITVSCRA